MDHVDVLLVQPLGGLAAPSGYMRTCYLEPIGLEYLAAALEANGYSTRIESGQISEEDVKNWVRQASPKLVGFSVHSYVFHHSLKLAAAAKEAARERRYDVVTLFGGPHATACPEDVAAEEAVDYVVVGEGEVTLVQLLQALTRGKDASEVAGLAFEKDGLLVVTDHRDRIRNLDDLPWPKRSHQFLDIARQYQIAYPPPGKQVRIAQVMYSRGCPFSCSFCSSENAWGRMVAWRSPRAVLEEIESLVEEFSTNLVYFPDLTFNVDRNRVLALCEEFRKRRPPVHWWALFRVDLLDAESLGALREAGCVKISLGLESPNPAIAKTVKGSYEARLSQIRRNLTAADQLGFIIKAFLIIGFPEETSEGIAGYKDLLFDLPIDELRVTFATPFPGTRFFQECVTSGLIDKEPDWATFTTEAPVLRHPSIANDQLVALREELVTGFYLDNRYICHATEKLARFPHLRGSWLEYFSFLDGKGVFAKNRNSLARLVEALHRVPDEVVAVGAEGSRDTRAGILVGKAQDGDSTPG